MDLLQKVRQALFLNELDGNPRALYRFSDAGGKSGLSFGLCQLDASNNEMAVACLRECGFTETEIAQVKRKAAADLNAKLAAASAVIDKYDNAQVEECLHHVIDVATVRGFEFADDEAIVHAADYHNQFFMSRDGKMAMHLAGLDKPVTGEDIRDFKLQLAWGKKRPDDVKRRYDNVVKTCR